MLAACCLLVMGFMWLRLWIVAQIDLDEATPFIAEILPEFIKRMLPVPLEILTTLDGRAAFGFEELPTLLLMALWTVARGTECLAGRLGDGTMEMLLAQPVRRLTLITSHTGVTILGVLLIGAFAWIGTALGLTTVGFDQPSAATNFLPAAVNYCCFGGGLIGAATFTSALARSRGQAVGFFIAFYVVEFTCKIFALTLPAQVWLKWLTFMTAYEPTLLTIGLLQDPEQYGPLFWQYNVLLIGLGAAALVIAATMFCHRDIPAPL